MKNIDIGRKKVAKADDQITKLRKSSVPRAALAARKSGRAAYARIAAQVVK